MNGKSMIMLLFAVVSGLGAMYGTSQAAEERQVGAVETQEVLVAARDLKVEELLKRRHGEGPGHAQVGRARRLVHLAPGRRRPLGPDQDSGKRADPGTEAGPQGDSRAALAARIPQGMRAFAIEVTESTGVSGFILPDHRVDVVQVRTATNGANTTSTATSNDREAETILRTSSCSRPARRYVTRGP